MSDRDRELRGGQDLYQPEASSRVGSDGLKESHGVIFSWCCLCTLEATTQGHLGTASVHVALCEHSYSSFPAQRCWLRGQIWLHLSPGLIQKPAAGVQGLLLPGRGPPVCVCPEGHLSEPPLHLGKPGGAKGMDLKTNKTLSHSCFHHIPAVRPRPDY